MVVNNKNTITVSIKILIILLEVKILEGWK